MHAETHPVARGYLTLTEADVSLIVHSSRLSGEYDMYEVARHAQFLLRQWLSREEEQRSLARQRIKRTLAPMIARRAPRNDLLAEAHGVNGAMDLPLTEKEVTAAVVEQVWRALPPAPGTGRHVG